MDAFDVDWDVFAIAGELGQSVREVRRSWSLDDVIEAIDYLRARDEIREILTEKE